MPNLSATLKTEISRLAKREIRREVSALKKLSAAHRRHIAALKRQIAELQRQAAQLAKRSRAAQSATAPVAAADSARFQARGLRSLRARFGLSQADMAKLLGVSALSVYNWEAAKARPRGKSLAAIVELRGLGKREARARLGG